MKGEPSREQLNVEPLFVDVKEKPAPVELVGLVGSLVIVVSGAVVSIVQL